MVLVVPAEGSAKGELPAEITSLVGTRIGAALRPHSAHVVEDLPRTRSGKILRRVIRAVYLGESPGDLSSIDNPAAIEGVRAVVP